MDKCLTHGCRNLQTTCMDCGRVVSTATFPERNEWINVKDKTKKPKIDEIVLAWMLKKNEPVCVRYEEDKNGPIWIELRDIDIDEVVHPDLISHWMPLPPPKINKEL